MNHCRFPCIYSKISEAIKKLEYSIHMHFTILETINSFMEKTIIKYIACYHSYLNSNLIYI